MSGQVRLRRRAAARARNCLQSDVGRRVQAAVADVSLAQGPRLGGAAHRQRQRRAPRHRDQCHARRSCSPAGRRCPNEGLSVEIVGSARHASSGGGTAGDPRRRHDASHERPHREDHARQGHRRCFARAATDHLQRRVRGAEHAHEDAAGARAASASTARCRPPPNCSRSIGCASSPARRSIPAGTRGHGQRARSSSACRCGPICRRARPTTTSPSIFRISAPTRCCSARRSRRRRCGSSANNQLYEIKGDVKIAGAPAQIEYRKLKGETDAEVKLQATLDEAARARLGLDVGPALAGPMPMKLTGRVGQDDREGRFNVEADLTDTKIENLLPGWVKPPARQARLAFTLVKQKIRRSAVRRSADRRAGRARQGHASSSTATAICNRRTFRCLPPPTATRPR